MRRWMATFLVPPHVTPDAEAFATAFDGALERSVACMRVHMNLQ